MKHMMRIDIADIEMLNINGPSRAKKVIGMKIAAIVADITTPQKVVFFE
jgi:hypothetical protein